MRQEVIALAALIIGVKYEPGGIVVLQEDHTDGRVPSGPTVAKAMADGSLGSEAEASAYQAAKSSSGSVVSLIITTI